MGKAELNGGTTQQFEGLRSSQMTDAMVEIANAIAKGRLAATFGKGDHKVFVFPTPVILQEQGRSACEFLIVTPTVSKAIHVEEPLDYGYDAVDAKNLSDSLMVRLGQRQSIITFSGYNPKKDTLRVGRRLITSHGTHVESGIAGDNYTENCRLVEIDSSRVAEILKANIERVESARAIAQKVSEMLV